jgi:hypothetical protein
MAVLPTEDLRWASEDVTEVTSINGVPVLVTNKVEPDPAFKNTGILARQRVGRARINWFFDLTSRYIKHLVERYAVGSVYTSVIDENVTTLSARLGGVWTKFGSTTVGGTPVYFFKKDE